MNNILVSRVGNVPTHRKSVTLTPRCQTISKYIKQSSVKEATPNQLMNSSLRIAKPKMQEIYDNLPISSHKTVNPSPPITSTNVVRPFEVLVRRKARKSISNALNFIPTKRIPIVPSPRVEVKQKTKSFLKSDVMVREIKSQMVVDDSSSMLAIQNAMIEQSTYQMTECIRSSLRSTMMNFHDIPVDSNQMLQEEVNQLRIKNDLLTRENRNMKNDLDQHNECIVRNTDSMAQISSLKEMVDQIKAENEQLKRTLRISELRRKKQWCATCDMPGNRYYCSKPCKDLAICLNQK
ncbi:uncharacterized protein LOC116347782 [Contarinia nasturtii]|uniref:uncharacterized protein LOC116347782 n=1 Tax=Contarinia nasturtii TaxID=265458 RepID=UPI0012D3BB50|nr:uncharacterized protein LOC116347782 [Contarinia nasturtii]